MIEYNYIRAVFNYGLSAGNHMGYMNGLQKGRELILKANIPAKEKKEIIEQLDEFIEEIKY